MNSKLSTWTRRQIYIREFGEEAWKKMSHAARQKSGRDFYHSGAYFKNGYVVAKRCKGGTAQTYCRITSLLQHLQQQ
ncbi:MAG: hypothetical protein JWR56_508 [Massilia sp.]|nr:hypothetical protein [Massilia sp.]